MMPEPAEDALPASRRDDQPQTTSRWWLLGLVGGLAAVAAAAILAVKVVNRDPRPERGAPTVSTTGAPTGLITYEATGPASVLFMIDYNDSTGSQVQTYVSLPWSKTVVIGNSMPAVNLQRVGFDDDSGVVLVIKRNNREIARCVGATSCHA